MTCKEGGGGWDLGRWMGRGAESKKRRGKLPTTYPTRYPELKGQNRNLDGSDFTDERTERSRMTNSGLVCLPECFVSRTASLPPFPPSPLCDHVPVYITGGFTLPTSKQAKFTVDAHRQKKPRRKFCAKFARDKTNSTQKWRCQCPLPLLGCVHC